MPMAVDTFDPRDVRGDFPALARRRGGKPPIYLNNTCMTLRPRSVIEAITGYYASFPTCGGGRLDAQGRLSNWFQAELHEHEVESRRLMAELLGAASPSEIVWTRNATEALNIVAHGLTLEPGDEVVGCVREHNSNLVPWLEVERALRKRSGTADLVVRRTFGLKPDGAFDLEQALAAITPRTRVLAIGHASNLDGTRIPDADIRALADRVHAVGGVLVLDAAQTVPHRRIDVQALGVDFLACSIHKMCGPTAMGVLYGRQEALTGLEPFIVGGDTVSDTWLDRVEYKPPPGRFEAGLQHYAGIVGTAAAIRYVRDHVGFEAIEAHERRLNRHLTDRLLPLLGDHLQLLGPVDADQRGGVLTLASHSGALINAIERHADRQANVMVRVGMFCSNAYLHERFDARGSAANNLRVSVYFYNTLDELDVFADIVKGVLADPVAAMDEGA
ncbi:MAG: aminotransferase class V-fold PLP-dependent enzyme [Planctomycetota bacterium]